MTNSLWVTLLCFFTLQSHCISSYDQQYVSDTAFFLHPAVSLHFILWPAAGEWHYIFVFNMQSHCISSYDQQQVSDTAFLFFTMQSHWTSCHDQQRVSDTLPCSLIGPHPVTNSKWVTHYHAVLLDFIPWPTACEWHCFFSITMKSHCISSHDQQNVGDTAFFSLPCSLIAFHPMTNSKWVTLLFILYHPVSLMNNSMWVTLLLFLLPCILIAFHPMTNRKWVTLLFLYYHAVSLHFIS